MSVLLLVGGWPLGGSVRTHTLSALSSPWEVGLLSQKTLVLRNPAPPGYFAAGGSLSPGKSSGLPNTGNLPLVCHLPEP